MKKVYKDYTQDQLEAAFNKVSNPKDWKDEINAIIDCSEIDVTVAAIEFFTATKVNVLSTPTQTAIYSVGYRMGPAGP